MKATPAYKRLQIRVTALEALVVAHAARLRADSGTAKTLQALAVSHSANLAASSTRVNALSAQLADLSTKAAQVAGTLATALTPKHRHPQGRTIHPRQVGGGKLIDAAVGKLDAAITDVGTKIDNDYAYLAALNTRARQSLLPAGNASGATAQAGAVVYSISGANSTQNNIHLANIIGFTALGLGATFGLALYRIRRGEASSLAPAKTPSSPAPAKA